MKVEIVGFERQNGWVTRFRWSWLFVSCLVFPATARADGIDFPILIGYGIGIFLPLLLFNATIEAPIMGRFLGVRFSEVWSTWFKANVWSLLSGIPVLQVNSMIKDAFVPTELGARISAYPRFLVVCILVYLVATVLVEYLCARRFARFTGVSVGKGRLFMAVALANAASYAVLGPAFYLLESPRSEVREFAADARWAKQPGLTVLAVGRTGHLEAIRVDGQDRRVVIPHEVKDYVVSSNLMQGLFRGRDDRFYLFLNGTNIPIPELGFSCRAPEMDFSPAGRYAAFFGDAGQGALVRVFDTASGKLRDVPNLGRGQERSLAWSTREDSFYLRSGKEYWEVTFGVPGSEVAYSRHDQTPPDLVDHYGRVGDAWGNEGAFYAWHEDGALRLRVVRGLGSSVMIWRQNGRVNIMTLRDPAGGLRVQQAVFLAGNEVMVEIGDWVYIADFAAKRMGPVTQGQKSIALTGAYAKRVDFD